MYVPAVDQNSSTVRPVEAVDDVAESCFARSVLAQEGMHFSASQVEGHIIVCKKCAELLRDTLGYEREVFLISSLWLHDLA